MGLLNIDAPKITNDYGNSMLPVLVYFDLETDGFAKTAEILQIAAKCNNYEFSVYITPTKKLTQKQAKLQVYNFIQVVCIITVKRYLYVSLRSFI